MKKTAKKQQNKCKWKRFKFYNKYLNKKKPLILKSEVFYYSVLSNYLPPKACIGFTPVLCPRAAPALAL
jgi:hypothetical protein